MKANKAAQQALITLLNGIYNEIRPIEEKLSLRLDGSDFRPRIEYFHDAVRALTSGAKAEQRLSVEFLAYDVAMLRSIQANPLLVPKETRKLSPGTDMVAGTAFEGHAGTGEIKSRLSELYKNYSVLFVALLSEKADHDYESKVNECNDEVKGLAAVEREAKKAMGKSSGIDIETIIYENMDDPALIQKFLNQFGNKRKGILADEAVKKLSDMMKSADKRIKKAEEAHFTFVTGQLAIYEMAKDVVKKMAMSGLNIVGSFVESAVREATRGGGRGH